MGTGGDFLVVCGGGRARDELRAVGVGRTVIAADGGADEAIRLGLRVDVVVGDMDSVTDDALARIEAEGGTIRRYPADKDAIDLELALDEALALGAGSVLVAGGAAGRYDFLVGNALVLAGARYVDVELDAWFGPATINVIRDARRLEGIPGERISLFAVNGPARGVHTEGLRWELHGGDLAAGVGLGMSNEFVGAVAEVRIGGGVVLAIRPGEGEAR